MYGGSNSLVESQSLNVPQLEIIGSVMKASCEVGTKVYDLELR